MAIANQLRWLLPILGLMSTTPACPPPRDEPPDTSVPDTSVPDTSVPVDGGASTDAGIPTPDDAGIPTDAGVPSEASDGGQEGSCRRPWKGDLQMGTVLADEALALAVDSDNNLFVAGYEAGLLGLTNIEPSGDAQAVVRMYTPDGTLQWKKSLDTTGTDTIEALQWDPTDGGRLHVAGRTDGTFEGTLNQGQFDLFIAALDVKTGGQVLRLHQTGNERPQHPRRLALEPEGGLVIAGYDDLYDPSNYVEDWENAFAARFVPTEGGSLERNWWLQSTTPGPDLVTGLAVSQGPDRESYLSGVSIGGSDEGMFVRKLRGDGSEQWSRKLSPLSMDMASAVALSPAGDLYVTGATFLTLGKRSFGQQDVFLMKLDRTTGATLWVRQLGTPESDWPTDLAFDSSGRIYIVGSTLGSFMNPQDGGRDTGDLFLLKLDEDGTLEGVWQRGTPAEDHPTALALDGCDHVFLAGYTEGALVEGPSPGGRDMFLLRVDALMEPGPGLGW